MVQENPYESDSIENIGESYSIRKKLSDLRSSEQIDYRRAMKPLVICAATAALGIGISVLGDTIGSYTLQKMGFITSGLGLLACSIPLVSMTILTLSSRDRKRMLEDQLDNEGLENQ